jgi:hypothetical protein
MVSVLFTGFRVSQVDLERRRRILGGLSFFFTKFLGMFIYLIVDNGYFRLRSSFSK